MTSTCAALSALAALGFLAVPIAAPANAQTLASASDAKVSIGGTLSTGDSFTTETSGGIEGPTIGGSTGGGGGGGGSNPPPPPPPKDYWPDCFICD